MPKAISVHNGDMLFETQIGDHKIYNDVPPTPEWGGKGRYPTPPDYFVASLSSCIAAFVVQYCNQVGLDATDMRVECNYEKVAKPAFLKDIEIAVHLPNADLGPRAEALKRVASQCTVHETISQMAELHVSITDRTASKVAA